jgi:hypothetical protein
MTLRAWIFGFIGAMAIAGFGFVNNVSLMLERVDAAQLMPVIVLVLMILIASIGWGMGALKRSWRFSFQELAVMTLMLLTACSVCGRGFMEMFPGTLAMPAHWNQHSIGWQESQLLDKVPDCLLPLGGEHDPIVTTGFVMGIEHEGSEWLSPSDVPYEAWATPSAIWLTLVALVGISMLCMCLVVHRQWADHERLRYPIATITATLLQPSRISPPLYKSKLFWFATIAVLLIHIVNGLHEWYPESIKITLLVRFYSVAQIYPDIWKQPGVWTWLRPSLYFSVVGISYFMASDVSLSIGLTTTVRLLIGLVSLAVGGSVFSGNYFSGGHSGSFRFGAYIAFTGMILYSGRRYYMEVFRGALGGRKRESAKPTAIWAMRVGLLSASALVVGLTWIGLNWTLAIVFVLLMGILFLVTTRITAETGMFFIQATWVPMGIMLCLFGGKALGTEALLIIGLATTILCYDPAQALSLYFINGLRLCDFAKIKTKQAAGLSASVYMPGIVLAVVIGLWASYNYGTPKQYGWLYDYIPKNIFNTVEREMSTVRVMGDLRESDALSAMGRVLTSQPKSGALLAIGVGIVTLWIVARLRLRHTWWPIHPILFLMIDTWPVMMLASSFFLGWAIKTPIVKFGGRRAYDAGKPFMIGLIVGELLGVAIFMIVGHIYYLTTGLDPVRYIVFPR